MSDDLVSRPWRCDVTGNPVGTDTATLGAKPCQCQGCRAATALTEARAEIERLKDGANFILERGRVAHARALAAESELSTLRARVREVVGPFSRLDISHTEDIDDSALVFENEGGDIVLGHLRAARQLNEDVK